MEPNTAKYHKTTDYAASAYLTYMGYDLVYINRDDPKRAVLYFRRDENLFEVVRDFWTKQAKVDPMTYFSHLKEIKSRIYNG